MDGDAHTVTGSVTAKTEGGVVETVTFALTRPNDADATQFSGTYRFTFSHTGNVCVCTSAADVILTFDRGGEGTAIGGLERESNGTVVAKISDGSASISPNGRLEVHASYDPTLQPAPLGPFLVMSGELHRSDSKIVGEGGAIVGAITADISIGAWTAERIE